MNVLLAAIGALFLLLLSGCLYQWLGTRRDRTRYGPREHLVKTSAGLMHLHPMGDTGATLVFESGLAASSLSWQLVQPLAARFARTYSYDRAGLGWSEAVNAPRTPKILAEELRDLLNCAKAPAPYVLVAHSFGALIARAFADLYSDQVSALLLVDPLAPNEFFPLSDAQQRRLAMGARLARRGKFLAYIGVVRFAMALLLDGQQVLSRAIGRVAGEGGATLMDRLAGEIKKLPTASWPIVAAHWCQPKCFGTMARYLDDLPLSAAEAAGFSSRRKRAIVLRPAASAVEDECLSGATVIHARSNGHWIHLDDPEEVVRAIRLLACG